MIRELAENPNVHQPHAGGPRAVHDPAGRFVVYLGTGTGPHSATVQRVRLDADEVEAAVAEIRALLRERGRGGSRMGARRLVHAGRPRRAARALGILADEDEPVAIGMVLEGRRSRCPSAGTSARRVASVDELVTARRIQHEAFGGNADEVDFEQAQADFATEGEVGSTFLAFADGEPIAAGYASYTPLGLLLFGGATLPRPVAVAATAHSSRRGPARRRIAARRCSSPTPARCRGRSSSGSDSSPSRGSTGCSTFSRPSQSRGTPEGYSGMPQRIADGDRHPAVHRHRGLDPPPAGARHRRVRGRARRSPPGAA